MPRFTPIVEIAPGATVTGNPNTYSWTDLTMQRYVHEPSGVSIRRGRQDRYSEASPDTCAVTLLNDGGRFVPRNPLSPWYGQITRGTPLRILMRPSTNTASDAFGRTLSSSWGSADTGGAWTNVGTASDYSVGSGAGRHTNTAATTSHFSTLAFSLIRVDVKVRMRVNALSTGGNQQAGVTIRYTGSADQKRAELLFATSGAITLRIVSRVAGVETFLASTTLSVTHSTSSWYWVRIQTGYTSVRAKAWLDGTTEPATWNIDGTSAALTATAGAIGCFSRRDTGNTNANATVDFDDFAFFDGPRTLFTGFVEQWPLRWNDAGMGQAFAPITASGQLQRLSRAKALRSPIYRATTALSSTIGYWPLEDGSTATRLASGLSAGSTGEFERMALASESEVVGSDPIAVFNTAISRIWFRVPSYTSTGAWSVSWLMKIPSTSLSSTAQLMSWITPGQSIGRWALTLVPGSPDVVRIDSFSSSLTSGTSVSFTDSSSSAELSDGRQLYFTVGGSQNGGNVDTSWVAYYDAADGSGVRGLGSSDSFAGTTGRINYIYHDANTGFTGTGHSIGHVTLGDDDTTFISGTTAILGGAGEDTDTRFGDLCATQGITGLVGDLVRGVASTTQQMGPQRSGDVLSQLREVEATEMGVLHDSKQGFLELLPRDMRYNRPVDLTLNFAAGQVGPPLEPADDDYQLRNDVTVTNLGGSTVLAQDATSIAASGVYPDSATVNVYQGIDLQQHADWRLALGTNGSSLRYPAITLDLTRNSAALVNAWCDTDIGSRIQVTNVPSGELPPETLDLILDGYTEDITSSTWKVTLNCSPGSGWLTAVLDASTPRLDCATTTAEALDTTETGVDVAIADTCVWSVARGSFGIYIGGELMTVTAVSAAVGAGSSWTQTLTVTRSVNGITKSHNTGAAVTVASPIILAL